MHNQSIYPFREPPLNLSIGGPSSIRFALFEAGDSLRRILASEIERIGLTETTLRVKGLNYANNSSQLVAATDHMRVVEALMDWIEKQLGCNVRHRVVHGASRGFGH